ncbi:MAG: M24 family metallopeptidase [Bacteriovoracales bacterium]|nr:M24 family metallopeptidase [Bacteriovoracales bacterium]
MAPTQDKKDDGSDYRGCIEKLKTLMRSKGVDYFYVSSTDPYLNEYVPAGLRRRSIFTHFSGSTAEMLFSPAEKVKLFVDGRYHEQADKEVNYDQIEVVKVKGSALEKAVLDAIPPQAVVGYEAVRTPLKLARQIEKKCQKIVPLDDEMEQILPFPPSPPLPVVENLEGKVDISPAFEKIARVFQDFQKDEALYLCALDEIAWISNLRGYHLPHLCSFLARAVVTFDHLHLFVDPSISFEDVGPTITIHRTDEADLPQALRALEEKSNWKTLFYDEASINARDHSILARIWGEDRLFHREGGLIPYMSVKDDKEIALIRESFAKSNRAITEVLRWVRASMARGKEISELDIYEKTAECYKREGAKDQSFRTISGVGAHSSIIHFNSPEANLKVRGDDVVLLDSGGYFESGFATDTTRTILAHHKADPAPQMVDIFTTALKGMLALQNAVVPEGTDGAKLDAIARTPIKEKGYDYAHGTGHGVGIYVHEGGINVSSNSAHLKLKAGQVFSVEPGIYIPGFGGVRHENIVVARPHPKREGHLYFEPLTWIEFDEALLDRSLLSSRELEWFEAYQTRCREMGNTLSFD